MESFNLLVTFYFCIPFLIAGSLLWLIFQWVKQFRTLKEEHNQLLKTQNNLLRELMNKVR